MGQPVEFFADLSGLFELILFCAKGRVSFMIFS